MSQKYISIAMAIVAMIIALVGYNNQQIDFQELRDIVEKESITIDNGLDKLD